ncbi:MAG: hypothetical protein CL609_20005 [Anaerolineaceae bacterium]|nr:hypothetical protein [Anaerolineaceae bacterium]
MLNKIRLGVSIVGSIDAVYLSIIKLTHSETLCMPGIGDCWTVNNSRYSEWNGIPISFFGIAAYVSIILIATILQKYSLFEKYGNFFIFGISTVGIIFSAYLTYLQIAVIRAICPFCIFSAITMTIVFIISLVIILKEL